MNNSEDLWEDEDMYPSEYALDVIANWKPEDGVSQWFEFIKGLHIYYPDFWDESERDSTFFGKEKVYAISTGGWSGNESLIYAMEKNIVLYNMTWLSSRRGGHYKFVVSDKLAENFPGTK